MCEQSYSESGALTYIKGCKEFNLITSDRDHLAGVVAGMEEQNARNLDALRREADRLERDFNAASICAEKLTVKREALKQDNARLREALLRKLCDPLAAAGRWGVIQAETTQRLHNGRIVHTWTAFSIFERIVLAWKIFCGAIRMLHHGEILAWGEDPYDSVYHENARLRATLAPILTHADAHDYAPPLKFSVVACREIKEKVNVSNP